MRLFLLSAAVLSIAAPAFAQASSEPQERSSMMRPPERETLAEMQARMGQMFDRVDTDHDGVVTTAQLQDARGARMLERADADQDGRITKDEMNAFVSAVFTRLDRDGDGVVTADERPRMRPGG